MKDALRDKLEVFIKKYYLNQLIKGLIYGIGLSLAYFFVVSVAEYFGRFSSDTRLVLLCLLTVGLVAILGFYIFYPLAKLLRIGKRISYEKAARLIGKHFPEVDDKILNTLQLQGVSRAQSDLLSASIDQRISGLTPVPFTRAIDFKENRKYWPVLIIPMLVFVALFVTGNGDVFREGGRRLAEYDKEFLPEAPFNFVLQNAVLAGEQGQDVSLDLAFEGRTIPAEVEIILPNGKSRMGRQKDGSFQFVMSNVQEDFNFRFLAAGFFSQGYYFKVIPVPQVASFSLGVVPPAYTRLKPFTTDARLIQDVPEGSVVSWAMNVSQAKEVVLVMDSIHVPFKRIAENEYTLQRKVFSSFDYMVKSRNSRIEKNSVSGNRVNVIKDEFPQIKVDFYLDSNNVNILYYSGSVADDYGINALRLGLKEGDKLRYKVLPLRLQGLGGRISGVLNLDSLSDQSDRSIKVFLEVGDNDGVNGSKRSRSGEYKLNLLGEQSKREQIEKDYESYFSTSQDNQEQLEEIQKALEKIRNELLNNKTLSFKEKSKLKDLLEKQQMLLNKQKENEKKLKELEKKEEKLGDKSDDVKKKEQEINKIDSEKEREVEDLMNEIQRLMDKLDINKLADKLEELQKSNEQAQKATDRKDNLLKDLKFQKDILEQADKLEQLSERMMDLSKKDDSKTEDGKSEEEEAQKDVKAKLDGVKEKVDQMKKENEKFKEATQEQGTDEAGEKASEEMREAQKNLNDNKQQNANDNQKKAGDEMKKMSESLQNSMMQMQAKANEVNMATLRKILENLEVLSFDVEALSDKSKRVEKEDPLFRKLLMEQRRLKEGTKVIEDSLTALAKKVPEIEQDVFKELDMIKSNLDKSIEDLQELRSGQAAGHQQYVMTSANNLALMLDQSLRQMQQMAAQSKPGDQQCQKPGNKPGSKPGMAQIREMQKGLGEKMDRMTKGNKEGKDNPEGKNGERGMSGEEMIKTISQQEQLRQALEDLKEGAGKTGSKGNLQKAIDEMKELERQMLEGELEPGYKERLKEIESRLLESERAQLKKKQDEDRESKASEIVEQLPQKELDDYLKSKEIEAESLQRLPVDFLEYYKAVTSKYINL
jgi:hypothetical protein